MICFQHQFDEALQRARSSVAPSVWAKLRAPKAQKLVKYFLQLGHIHAWQALGGQREEHEDMPWLCKPIAMQKQDYLSISNALMKCMAFNLDDKARCLGMLAVLTVVMLQFSCDRFAANKKGLEYI